MFSNSNLLFNAVIILPMRIEIALVVQYLNIHNEIRIGFRMPKVNNLVFARPC